MKAPSLVLSLAFASALLASALTACVAPTVNDDGPRRGTDGRGGDDGTLEDGDTEGDGGAGRDRDGATPPPPGDDASTGEDAGPEDPPPPGVGDLTPGKSTLTWSVAGKPRTIELVVPSAITTQAVPLVIALHGNGDTAPNFMATRGLAQLAESKGFVVAAPQGITQNINVSGQQVNGVSWDAYRTLGEGNIDLALLDELRDQLVTPGGQIDAKRVIVFGYSQGGYLAFRYGIDEAAKLACASVAAASSPLGTGYIANATRKIPYALTIGDKDYGISQARAAKTALTSAGHPLDYRELAGAGHSPFPGTTADALAFCLGKSLP